MVSGLQAMILEDVAAERNKQDTKWGADRNLPWELWITVLGEEYGEVCKGFLEKDFDNFRQELVQLAAVSFAIIEAIDRQAYD